MYFFPSEINQKSIKRLSYRADIHWIEVENDEDNFLANRYRFSGDLVYCGNELVIAHPLHVSESMVVMEYQHRQTGEKAHLVLHPFKENEMTKLLQEAGFRSIKSFGDYKQNFKPEQPEFITYVAEK